MIFTIQTDDEVAGLDIINALNRADIKHTILSKQHDTAVQYKMRQPAFEQALIIAHELKTKFKIGNWSHFIGETSFDKATDIEIADIILNIVNAA